MRIVFSKKRNNSVYPDIQNIRFFFFAAKVPISR